MISGWGSAKPGIFINKIPGTAIPLKLSMSNILSGFHRPDGTGIDSLSHSFLGLQELISPREY